MAESSKVANTSRQTQIKNEQKGFLPESKIISKWREVSDTNLGTFKLEEFMKRIFGHDGHPLSIVTKKIVRSGIVAVVGFPSAIHFLELIIECAKHYNAKRRAIVAPDGKLLANHTTEAIGEAFGILAFQSMMFKTKERAAMLYDSGIEGCARITNRKWMQNPKPHHSKMPKKLISMDFKQECGDLVRMMSQIMGFPQAFIFEPWMFCFIEEVMDATKMVDWARMISNNLDEQLRNLKHSQSFYMSSYIVYMLARMGKFSGLSSKGPMRCGLG